MENKCNTCGEEFNESELSDNGIDYVCPFCKSDDWDTATDEE